MSFLFSLSQRFFQDFEKIKSIQREKNKNPEKKHFYRKLIQIKVVTERRRKIFTHKGKTP